VKQPVNRELLVLALILLAPELDEPARPLVLEPQDIKLFAPSATILFFGDSDHTFEPGEVFAVQFKQTIRTSELKQRFGQITAQGLELDDLPRVLDLGVRLGGRPSRLRFTE